MGTNLHLVTTLSWISRHKTLAIFENTSPISADRELSKRTFIRNFWKHLLLIKNPFPIFEALKSFPDLPCYLK